MLADYTQQASRLSTNTDTHTPAAPVPPKQPAKGVEFLPRTQSQDDGYQDVSRYQQVLQQSRVQRQGLHKLQQEKRQNLSEKQSRLEEKTAEKDNLDKQQESSKNRLEQQQIAELKARDQEVRQHEMAHMAAGGQYAGTVSYSYTKGPDGVQYAVSGEVSIDMSKEQNPEQTIVKMQQVQRAALAPAEPSAQDRQVAASAAQQINLARAELLKSKQEENKPDAEKKPDVENDTDKTEQTDKTTDKSADKKKTDKKQAEDKPKTDYVALYNKRRQEIYQFLQDVLQQPNQPQSPLLRDKA